MLYALSAADVAEIWSAETGAPSLFSDGSIAGGVLFLNGYDGFAQARDPATGDLIWDYQTGTRNWIAPAVVEQATDRLPRILRTSAIRKILPAPRCPLE